MRAIDRLPPAPVDGIQDVKARQTVGRLTQSSPVVVLVYTGFSQCQLEILFLVFLPLQGDKQARRAGFGAEDKTFCKALVSVCAVRSLGRLVHDGTERQDTSPRGGRDIQQARDFAGCVGCQDERRRDIQDLQLETSATRKEVQSTRGGHEIRSWSNSAQNLGKLQRSPITATSVKTLSCRHS